MFDRILGFALWHLRRDFSVRETEELARAQFPDVPAQLVRDALFWAVQGRLKPGELERGDGITVGSIFTGGFEADRFRVQAIVTVIIDGEEQTRIVHGVVPNHFTQLDVERFMNAAARNFINENYPGEAGTGIEITSVVIDAIIPINSRFM